MTSFNKASEFHLVRNDAQKLFEASLTMPKAIQSWMARKGYPMYQRAQEKRWITGGASEGDSWKALKSSYVTWKNKMLAKDPARYPGGARILVLTGDLFKSVSGKELTFHRAIFTDKGFSVATTIPYAKYVNEKRHFVGFGTITTEKIKTDLKQFVMKHVSRGSI